MPGKRGKGGADAPPFIWNYLRMPSLAMMAR